MVLCQAFLSLPPPPPRPRLHLNILSPSPLGRPDTQATVCNLEYLPRFVLERKSTLHQMSAEKEHWASEWVVLKELNNGFQQC